MTYPTDEEMVALKALWEAEERMLTPLPWRVEHGTQYDGQAGLVSIVGANGDTVADNRRYYPHRVKPVDLEYIVRAVNAHDALVAALVWIAENPIAHPRNMVAVADAALVAARK